MHGRGGPVAWKEGTRSYWNKRSEVLEYDPMDEDSRVNIYVAYYMFVKLCLSNENDPYFCS